MWSHGAILRGGDSSSVKEELKGVKTIYSTDFAFAALVMGRDCGHVGPSCVGVHLHIYNTDDLSHLRN